MGRKKTIIIEKKDRKMGRPRKRGVARYADGQIKREARKEDVMSVALQQRMKEGLSEAEARSDLAGFAVGRYFHAGDLQRHHLDAAERWHHDVERWKMLNGIGRGTARTSSLSQMIPGSGVAPDEDQYIIDRCRRAYEDARDAILNGVKNGYQRACMDVLEAVVVRGEYLIGSKAVQEIKMGLLREGLNVLARHYRVL